MKNTCDLGVFILPARHCVYDRVLYLRSEQNTTEFYKPHFESFNSTSLLRPQNRLLRYGFLLFGSVLIN